MFLLKREENTEIKYIYFQVPVYNNMKSRRKKNTLIFIESCASFLAWNSKVV